MIAKSAELEEISAGIKFVTEAAEEVKNEPVGRKSAARNLPFVMGKAFAAYKARDLYIARYRFLH